MSNASIDALFCPRSVAVIGASNREGSVGRALFANILMNGYTGMVFPVNMTARSVLGVKAYPSVLDIEEEIDLAILIVPALAVPATMAECGQKKVKAAVVISAGFKELGPTGAQLEAAVRDRARQFGIRMVGPNCFGLTNSSPKVRLSATFGRTTPSFGNIALVSQSGAIGVNALEYAENEEVGLSKFISIGNKADVNECDLLAYLRDDDETDVIMLYLEDLVNPAEFMRIARETTSHPRRPKPILAIKAGRTSEGARAASSHTGALAGSDEAYNAFFAQSRILRVETINELFAKAAALAYQPTPKGPRVAILTNAGGVGIMATDACVRNGLTIAPLTPRTREELKKHLPATAATSNPVDVIGDSDEKRYATALRLLLDDESVDGIIPIWTPTLMAEAEAVASAISEAGTKCEKPILACIQTIGDSRAVRRALLKDRIPHYQFPENAARAMAAMAEFAAWSHRPQGEVRRFEDTKPDVVRAIIAQARSRKPVFISEPESHEIMRAYGLPVLPARLVKTEDEAVRAGAEIGYPLVIKIVSPDILHKTDFGGVKVNITDEAMLRQEFAAMLEAIHRQKPDADIWGVFVQKMAEKGGTETIIGMNRDPQFGPLLMFGLGGVLVEALKDVTFRVAPINDLSADSMIAGIRAHKLLEAFRGRPARDTACIKECLQRVSQLVTDFPDFAEMDINPLLVYETGRGAAVLDARFLLR
uniref:CoA-binding protein n=1 Tax=candidate division WOR-3 bacterium TaxID=2052148 RepID=A0A7C4CAW4_UNCW3